MPYTTMMSITKAYLNGVHPPRAAFPESTDFTKSNYHLRSLNIIF